MGMGFPESLKRLPERVANARDVCFFAVRSFGDNGENFFGKLSAILFPAFDGGKIPPAPLPPVSRGRQVLMSRHDFRGLDRVTKQVQQSVSETEISFMLRPPLAGFPSIFFCRRTGAMTGPARQLVDSSIDGFLF